jgi:hypothetical protein
MKYLIMVLVLAASANAQDMSVSVGIPGTTGHSTPCDCLEDNNLLAVTALREDGWGLSVARFTNSVYRHSTAVQIVYAYEPMERTRVTAGAGAVTGYGGVCGNPCSLLTAEATFYLLPWLGVSRIQMGFNVHTYTLVWRPML